MWGMRRRPGPEEQSPRDRKGRMRHVTKYPLLEDCGKSLGFASATDTRTTTPRRWPSLLPARGSTMISLPSEATADGHVIRKRLFQMLRPACARFQRMRPRIVHQLLDWWFHRDRRRHWARCPIVLLPPNSPGRHAAY